MIDQNKPELESTLYMPSMYDSEDDEEMHSIADARDENTCERSERIDTRHEKSQFSLMRCLAWSHAEDDKEDMRLSEREEDWQDDDVAFLIRNASGGCASFNSLHSAMVDSTPYAPDNNTKNVHWEERVEFDKKLESLLSGKNVTSALS